MERVNFFNPTFKKRVMFFIFWDMLFSIFSLYTAYLLRFNFNIETKFFHNFWTIATVFISIKLIFFLIFQQYKIVWRFYSLSDAKRLFYAHILSYVVIIGVYLIFEELFLPFPRSVIVIDALLSFILTLGFRLLKRVFIQFSIPKKVRPTLIFGLNDYNIIKGVLESDLSLLPVGIIVCSKENKDFIGGYVDNIKIYPKNEMSKLIKKFNVKTAIVAKKLKAKKLSNLIDELKRYGIKEIKRVKLLNEGEDRLETIQIEELLAREPKDLDSELIREFIKDKVIVVTGGGGSIGSQISKELSHFGAKLIIIIENSEFNLYKISQNLDQMGANYVPVLENVCNRDEIEKIFKSYKVDIVIHTSAYKHVPLCERNPKSAIRNNIIGAINIFELSIKYKVKKVVNISSDKAVRPTNVMGASKRVIELYAQNIPSNDTEIVSVRFGNVLESSGSVVPKFKKQIERGESVTVTHPDITRYFMLIDEACKLVLQAGAVAQGREIFILDMGEPIKIVDLAKRMIELYGKEDEVKIEFIGLRAGEKLYEELLIDDAEYKTKYDSIYVAKETYYPFEELKNSVDELLKSDEVRKVLKKIVPEFKPAKV